jgi:hypothetical protein
MQARGGVSPEEHKLRVLDSRQEMTGADRQWAGQYEEGDLVRYTRGSKVLGIEPGEHARVCQVDAPENRISIERENGTQQTYDPRRLSGVAVYHEVQREFSEGDRIQFTAPSRELQVANRELGTIERLSNADNLEIRLDSGREVRFSISEHPHLDHGYAVTSPSGVYSVADHLRLDYAGLKKRLGGVSHRRRKARKPAFVELMALPSAMLGECWIEFESLRGGKVRCISPRSCDWRMRLLRAVG